MAIIGNTGHRHAGLIPIGNYQQADKKCGSVYSYYHRRPGDLVDDISRYHTSKIFGIEKLFKYKYDHRGGYIGHLFIRYYNQQINKQAAAGLMT